MNQSPNQDEFDEWNVSPQNQNIHVGGYVQPNKPKTTLGVFLILSVFLNIILFVVIILIAFNPGETDTITLGDNNSVRPPDVPTMTSNTNWLPVEREIDGVMMVLVPPGCFNMGSDNVAALYGPAHRQCISEPFWIDKYEVTNKQFNDFGGIVARNSYWSYDDFPRESLTWFEARDYCQLRGGRLPTEREWEYAARGPSNLMYPWGNEFIPDYVVYSRNSRSAVSVGSRSNNISWVGAVDMIGNVEEWVSSLYDFYPYDTLHESDSNTNTRRMVRGGSWYDEHYENLRTFSRTSTAPTSQTPQLGLRCVKSYRNN